MTTQLEERRITRPAKRWRNFYFLERPIEVEGEMRGPGRTPSKYTWPSKDIAETMAARQKPRWEKLGASYLGAEEEP